MIDTGEILELAPKKKAKASKPKASTKKIPFPHGKIGFPPYGMGKRKSSLCMRSVTGDEPSPGHFVRCEKRRWGSRLSVRLMPYAE